MITKTREHKGNNIIELPCDFTIIDIETDGYAPKYCSIIELSAIRIRNNVPTESFSSLVLPYEGFVLDEYITELTGITQEMVDGAPDFIDTFKAIKQKSS